MHSDINTKDEMGGNQVKMFWGPRIVWEVAKYINLY